MTRRLKPLRNAALCVLAAIAGPAAGCINTVGTDHQGRSIQPYERVGQDLVRSLYWRDRRYDSLDEVRRLAAAVEREPDFENLTGLAVATLRAGRYDSAIRLLLSIERHYPGRYETAANLGTALELAGHDAAALRWIGIGIRRNSRSHQGSEWLHARILRAKLAVRANPGHYKTHSIAGVAFDGRLVPSLPTTLPRGNDGHAVDPIGLNQALAYQLAERVDFVAAPDPVIANLALDWATLNLAGGPIETARSAYGLAIHYGARLDRRMLQRLGYIAEVLTNRKATSGTVAGVPPACPLCRPPPPPPPPGVEEEQPGVAAQTAH